MTVVDVRFRNNAKTYFFDPGELRPGLGAHVIIETARGDEFGICAGMRHEVKASEIVPPLRKVLRLATAQDEAHQPRQSGGRKSVLSRSASKKSRTTSWTCSSSPPRLRSTAARSSSSLRPKAASIPGTRQRPCVFLPHAHRAAADRRQRQGEDGGRTWRVRKTVLLQGISGRFPAGLHQDGEDTESEPQPTKISGTCGRLMMLP